MSSPSLNDYFAVMKDLAELPNPPLLIGRMAMVVFGSEQLTHDIDLISPNFPEIISVLYRHGFKVISSKKMNLDGSVDYEVYEKEVEGRYAIGLRKNRSLQSVNPETGAELDIWLETSIAYADLMRNSTRVDLGGLEMNVPSIENMIRLKEDAMRDDPRRRIKDEWDVNFLRDIIEKRRK